MFCRQCDNFIYDAKLDETCVSAVIAAEEKLTKFQGKFYSALYNRQAYPSVVLKNPREPYKAWIPTEREIAALEDTAPIPCQGWTYLPQFSPLIPPCTGRRGLLNLGQTCFLNVVLQCFVHNPLLRNYFLGDKHNWRQCKVENCSCCEMDKLFAEV